MGFEFLAQYHERLEDGSYDKENVKTLKKRVGKAEEEIGYDKLAGTIMAQLARRDIWVIDVEVYEFSKKKLTFRETKGGLVIGNKKFGLDECGHLGIQEVEEVAPVAVPAAPAANFKPALQGHALAIPEEMLRHGNVNVADLQLLKMRPMRYEIFQPDPMFADNHRLREMDFTVGEKYPIYAERAAGNDNRLGMNYTTLDNHGRKQVVNDKFFVPAGSLIGEQFNEKRDVSLHYGDDGGFDMPMPSLR